MNLPYILLGLFCHQFWGGLAAGCGYERFGRNFFLCFLFCPPPLQSFWPSLHPLDLLVGICCGAALRLAVYVKGKNAKKYRKNMEYGSARWSA